MTPIFRPTTSDEVTGDMDLTSTPPIHFMILHEQAYNTAQLEHDMPKSINVVTVRNKENIQDVVTFMANK
jgi:hypothetical protein